MIGKNIKLVIAGLSAAVLVAVPAVSQASHYMGTTPPSIAGAPMLVDVPATTISLKSGKLKHSKHKASKLTSSKHHANKKHTKTIVSKHHHNAKTKKLNAKKRSV